MNLADLEQQLELEVEALDWQPSIAGGQLLGAAIVAAACVGLTAFVTYVIEEVRHDPGRHRRHDEEP